MINSAYRSKDLPMTQRPLMVEPVAQVIGGRSEPTDDYWGGTRSVLRINSERFDEQSTVGIEGEAVWRKQPRPRRRTAVAIEAAFARAGHERQTSAREQENLMSAAVRDVERPVGRECQASGTHKDRTRGTPLAGRTSGQRGDQKRRDQCTTDAHGAV